MRHSESHANPTAVIMVSTPTLALAVNYHSLPSSILESLLLRSPLNQKVFPSYPSTSIRTTNSFLYLRSSQASGIGLIL